MKKILAALLCAILLLSCMTAFAASSYIVATGDVNVRSGPGLGYSILGTIRKGGTLDSDGTTSVDSRGVAWYRVYYGSNTYGWVSSVWATLYSGGSGSVVQPGGATYVRATASVNLRSGPGTGYDDIGTLAKGEQVRYLSSSTDSRGNVWYQVQYYSYGTGWVSSVYSELVYGTSSGVADTPTNVAGSYVKATNGKSNLRTGPGLGYADVGTMQKGESATYLGSYSTDERGVVWYQVRFEGQTGWVSSRYTTLY